MLTNSARYLVAKLLNSTILFLGSLFVAYNMKFVTEGVASHPDKQTFIHQIESLVCVRPCIFVQCGTHWGPLTLFKYMTADTDSNGNVSCK